jgi:hypothetical protein
MLCCEVFALCRGATPRDGDGLAKLQGSRLGDCLFRFALLLRAVALLTASRAARSS